MEWPSPENRENERLRLAIFTGVYDYIKDGISLTLNRLVRHLEARGTEVLIFAPTRGKPVFETAGTLVSVPSIPLVLRPDYRVALGLPRAARQRLAAFRPTLFHVAVPDILGYRALRLGQKWGIPVVASCHTRYNTYGKYYGIGFLEKHAASYLNYFYGQCAEVYTPSQSMTELLRAENPAINVRYWGRGVDSDRFHPGKRAMDWRRGLGIGDDEVLITFVSRLVLEKGLDRLATILTALKASGARHRGMIVGDGPERGMLAARLPDTLFTGFLDGEDLARAYASSDIFLFPSVTETFGNVTLEAMASGLPTVCADATGSSSLVRHGVSGFLADPGRDEEYVGYLKQLIGDGGLRTGMGNAGLDLSATYSWDTAMERLISYYHDAMNTEPPDLAASGS